MGSSPVRGSENSFSEYLDFRSLLSIIFVTLTLYPSHQSIYIENCHVTKAILTLDAMHSVDLPFRVNLSGHSSRSYLDTLKRI